MPYEIKNYAAEGVANGTISADKRLEAQMVDAAKNRNDYFNLMGQRMQALSTALPNNVGYVNAVGDKALNAFRGQMSVDSQGSSYWGEPLSRNNIAPEFARRQAAEDNLAHAPTPQSWNAVIAAYKTNPNAIVNMETQQGIATVPARDAISAWGGKMKDNAQYMQQIAHINNMSNLVTKINSISPTNRPPLTREEQNILMTHGGDVQSVIRGIEATKRELLSNKSSLMNVGGPQGSE